MRSVPQSPRIAVYVRVSSEDQAEKQTIQNQLDFFDRWVPMMGKHVVGIYKDDGVSGTIPLAKREGGARLMADARAGKFAAVVVHHLDRLGRSLRSLLDAYEELDAMGVAIQSATEPFDTSNPIGRFVFQLLASIAELERETIRGRTMLGRARAAREGRWTNSPVPWGYTVAADGLLVEDEKIVCDIGEMPATEADVVRRAFTEVASGASAIATAALFNRLGIPAYYKFVSRSGKREERKPESLWTGNKVANMIRGTIYRGLHIYTTDTGEAIERHYPPLIDASLWGKANERLTYNRRYSTKNARVFYLLRGLIRCGLCGKTYTGRTAQGRGRVYRQYSCNGKVANVRRNGEHFCPSKIVSAPELESLVWHDVTARLQNRDAVMAEAYERLRAGREPNVAIKVDRKEEITRALATITTAKARTLELYTFGRITLAEFDAQRAPLDREEQTLQAELATLSQIAANVEAEEDYLRSLDTMLRVAESELASLHASLQSHDPEIADQAVLHQRQLIELLVERIIIDTLDNGGSGSGLTTRHKDWRYRLVLR